MQKTIIIISAIMACAAAAVYIEDYPKTAYQGHDTYFQAPVYPVQGISKSTLTKSSHVVNHGGTAVVHAPVYHEIPVAHAPVYHSVPVVHALGSAKSTITKSSQVVNHGGTAVVHAPVYHEIPVAHAPTYHSLPVAHELSSAKSTVTKSSQVVNHGATYHAPLMTLSHVPVVSSAKSTITKSSQVVNHGGEAIVHAPLYNEVSHEVYPVHSSVVYAPQVYSGVKTGDSAVSHHSSTVHETEPVVNHYPLYSFH